MDNKKTEYIGKEFVTNEGYTLIVTNYINNKKVNATFKDCGLVVDTTIRNLTMGQIKNPFHKSVYNKGFYGIGKYTARHGKQKTAAYIKWISMMNRCYDVKYHRKEPSYIGCVVCEEWLNFQTFAEWFYQNNIDGYELDKDLLVKGNKTYSPETCCFVPKKLNTLLNLNKSIRNHLPIGVYEPTKGKYATHISLWGRLVKGVEFDTIEDAFNDYKTKKEAYIKEVAEKFKHQITPNVYNALMMYNVDIDD